jgi:ABC-2 type transport system permease protein
MSAAVPTTTHGAGDVAAALARSEVRARTAGFVADLVSVAGRALRQIPRDLEMVIPALIVPVFFFAVNIGQLENLAESGAPPGFDFKAFQLPVAIIFAVTGISRASALVTDIQGGYFDRLLISPVNRNALLLGLMVADFTLVVALCLPVLLLGFVVGVSFETGLLGILAFLLMAGAWGLVFTGFPYAIALKTGNPGAVNASFLLFFPFAFLTTSFVPEEALSGWLQTVANLNPVTYLLAGLRTLVSEGWEAEPLLQGFAAILLVGLVSQVLAFLALRGRTRRT